MFYVYEWFDTETDFVFYVGKGTHNRYKHLSKRNRLFKDYVSTHSCSSRIIREFDTEQDALDYEQEHIVNLKNIGQCTCNLDNGGTGGLHFVWTPEMRRYKSKYNPMRDEIQRKRMSEHNPMSNPDIASRVAKKKSRQVIVKGILFNSVVEAAKYFNRHDTQIITWCKRGYDSDKEPCRYADEEQKEFVIKISNSKLVIIDGVEFESVLSAAKYLGVWSESIIRAIHGNRKIKGHTCSYGNQQPSHGKSDNSTMEGSTTNG